MTEIKKTKAPQSVSTSAKVKMGSNVLISLMTGAAILLMVNYLSIRHYHRGDWTSSGLYTLSEKSEKVAAALKQEVVLYVLWSQGDPRFMDVKELLDNYDGLSSKIKVEMVDPDTSPERVQLIIQKYGAKVQMDAQGNMGIEAGIFVTSGDNVKFVSAEEFEDKGDNMLMDDPGSGEEMSSFMAEQELTSALMRVTSDRQIKLCFTQGHGERPLEGYGPGSLGHIKEGLKRDSYQVDIFSTAGATNIPADCDTVIVAGPTHAFMAEEAKLLKDYLDGGGKLMMLLDPTVEGDRFSSTGLESLCAANGIRLANNILLETDPRKLPSDTPVTFLASAFGTHKAVAQFGVSNAMNDAAGGQLQALPVVFSMARSISEIETDVAVVDNLVSSSPMSWGEVNLASLGSGDTAPMQDQYDTDGPAVIAMAAVRTAVGSSVGGKLVVIGDSDFLEEELFVNAGLYNRDFWSGLVGWVTAREDLVSIAPKNPEHIRLNLTEGDVSSILWTLVAEIILIIMLGVVVWFRRRS